MKFEAWVNRNSQLILVAILFLYVLGAVLAPVFMKFGWEIPARFLYWIYSNFCHQFAYRSWFLFGEQYFYPLDQEAGGKLTSYQEAFGLSDDEYSARSIIGNEDFGFKMALCQRDIAMYSSLMFFGILYLITGKRLTRISTTLWIVFGMLPIGIDGIIQFLGTSDFGNSINWMWESTPLIRTLTGISFGIFTGWFIFPMIELIQLRSACKNQASVSTER